MSCPNCGGKGRVPGVSENGLVCLSCDGTGDYFRACVNRAYHRGLRDGVRGLADGSPRFPERPRWDALIAPFDD